MDVLVAFLIAVGLSMDIFAVAIACGSSGKNARRGALFLALAVGIAHVAMSGAGFAVGTVFRDMFSAIDHWLAFLMLAYVGGRMALSAMRHEGGKCAPTLDFGGIAAISFATSIDAFGVGMGFAFMDADMLLAIGIIGAVTFLFTLGGTVLGRKAGAAFGDKANLAGGIVLVAIGLKILIEHTLG